MKRLSTRVKNICGVCVALLIVGGAFGQITVSPPGSSNALTSVSTGNNVWVDAVNGSDSTGARGRLDKPFLTLAAAKTAASSGDTIVVLPGSYNERNLLKNGVNWYFYLGAIVAYVGSVDGGIFDDSASTGANAAITSTIGGFGKFTYTFTGTSGTSASPILLTNASSNVSVRCNYIAADGTQAGLGGAVVVYGVWAQAGTLSVKANQIEFLGNVDQGYGVAWLDGQCYIEADEITVYHAAGTDSNSASLYSKATTTPVGQWYVNARLVQQRRTNATSYVFLSSMDQLSTNARIWITANQILSSAPGAIDIGAANGAFVYVTAQKITGSLGNNSGSGANTSTYVTAQKWSASTNQPIINITTSSGKYYYLHIGQFDDANLSASAVVSAFGATNRVYLIGADIKRTTTGDAVAGSSLISLFGAKISGVTSGYDLDQSGGGSLTVSGTQYDAANTTGTITRIEQAYDADLTTWAGITPGTGVATALAINTGSAGSFVTNGGAGSFTTVTQTGKTTTYNNIATEGNGLGVIVKATRVTAQTAANSSIATYTTPASDGSYIVSGNINVTAAIAISTSLNCDYTDETNTARTMIIPISGLGGTFLAGGLATSTGPFESSVMHIRTKASTAITIYTAAGTFTSATYNAEGVIRQLQ